MLEDDSAAHIGDAASQRGVLSGQLFQPAQLCPRRPNQRAVVFQLWTHLLSSQLAWNQILSAAGEPVFLPLQYQSGEVGK